MHFDSIREYAHSLDTTTFGHHFLLLSHLIAEIEHHRISVETEGVRLDSQTTWARLEYECLLWQVRLPSDLLDLRDELPATPKSVVIHCLSNTTLLSIYSYILERADTLGTLLALRPVPGVLLFLCALARSTFICPREVLERWSLLVDLQAATARIMLRLWRQTGFENCRAILNMWTNMHGRYGDLAREVRQEIGPGPWTIDEIDGYSVFWTFRDLRALTIELLLADRL
jgi:hypothetical protein